MDRLQDQGLGYRGSRQSLGTLPCLAESCPRPGGRRDAESQGQPTEGLAVCRVLFIAFLLPAGTEA